MKKGDKVEPGQTLGTVQEQLLIKHKIMMPPGKRGTVKEIHSGNFTVEDTICVLEDGTELPMIQYWPVRRARPSRAKQAPTIPLRTGQRVIDGFFSLAKGGTAAIPGGFGTGKDGHAADPLQSGRMSTSSSTSAAANAAKRDGQTSSTSSRSELVDPRTNRPLMERSIVYANTSNMPVAAPRGVHLHRDHQPPSTTEDMGFA